MSNPLPAPIVVVIGAGIAGLLAARELSHAGAAVVVVDKGRGVGGRMATRRSDGAVFDHGAQFLTARSVDFRSEVALWEAAGVATPWFTGRLGSDGVDDSDDLVRHRGVPAMTGIAKHLATGLDVRRSALVTSVRRVDQRWQVEIADDDPIVADAVVVTAPAPQTIAMFDPSALDPHDRERLEQIEYDPSIAVLAVLDGSAGLTAPGARRLSGGPVAWFADNQAKGVSDLPSLTVHATPEASRALWDDDDDVVVARLLDGLELGGANVRSSHVHRWRYARPAVSLPEPCLLLRGAAPCAIAGDGFGAGGRIETAALSGLAAAAAVAGQLGLG